MKMYVFCHQWLSATQHGVQGAHAIVELGEKVRDEGTDDAYRRWAKHHKTTIFLQGGNSANLIMMERQLHEIAPYHQTYATTFCEDNISLNNAVTSLAFLADEEFCELLELYQITSPDSIDALPLNGHEIIQTIARSRLA